jgi:hypothetical protein
LSLPAQFETGSAIVNSLTNTYIRSGSRYYNKLPARLRHQRAQVRGATEKRIKPDNFVV